MWKCPCEYRTWKYINFCSVSWALNGSFFFYSGFQQRQWFSDPSLQYSNASHFSIRRDHWDIHYWPKSIMPVSAWDGNIPYNRADFLAFLFPWDRCEAASQIESVIIKSKKTVNKARTWNRGAYLKNFDLHHKKCLIPNVYFSTKKVWPFPGSAWKVLQHLHQIHNCDIHHGQVWVGIYRFQAN